MCFLNSCYFWEVKTERIFINKLIENFEKNLKKKNIYILAYFIINLVIYNTL